MKYIEYLDLPKIPENLLESVQDIISKPPSTSLVILDTFLFFKQKNVSNELKEWLQSIFDFKIDPYYQLIYNGLPIHIDKGNRIYAYNYLLETGGNNVRTVIYNQNYKKLQSEILQINQWHRINTSMLHGVHGIELDKVRVAVSVSEYANNI
jgi:hypothetical protein